jgi:anti-sigma factor RsiW
MNARHADLGTLVAYWLGELDEAREASLEEHYVGCAECSARLAEVEALAEGVKRAYASGRVGAVVTGAFVERLRARGLKLREYHVPRNGSVNCSIGPEHDVLLGYLEDVPLQGVSRVDAVVVLDHEIRLEDVPFDVVAGQVILAPSVELIRSLPAHREVVRLVSVEDGGERVLGEYTFNHSQYR